MFDKLTFKHTADASIVAAFRRPTPAEFGAYWNDLASGSGAATYTAKTNLVVACRIEPDADTFRALLDEDWSALPGDAADALLGMAGLFGLAPKAGDMRGEIVDMRALVGRLEHVADSDLAATTARAAFHADALAKLGADESTVRRWAACANPHISRVCVALPMGGYYVGRVPKISDRVAAQNVQRAPVSDEESGAYAALVRLLIDCCEWCGPMSITSLIERWPGAAAKLGMLVRDLGGGYSAEIGK